MSGGGAMRTPEGPPAVHVDAVSKRHAGASRPVLDRLDVTCPAGAITIVVGPSGCGKTTLLRCLCGLETVSSGRILFGDRDVTDVEAEHRGVAMVFQNYALYPSKTVAENIAFPLRMARVPEPERRRRVEAAAELVRIEGLLDRMPAQLSGGQRQRVGIARAIVRGPRVLLMDEPLSNLDTKLRTEMRAELGLLQRSIGATTVYVTHDQTEALALADHLILLRDGAVEQQGKPAEIFSRPASTFAADFLGHMNLLAAEEGLHEGVRIPATAPAFRPGGTIGFRAEEMRVGPVEGDALVLSAKVQRSELLGTDRLVHLRIGGQAVRARLTESVSDGDDVVLSVAADHVHYFDEAGRRLSGPGGNRP